MLALFAGFKTFQIPPAFGHREVPLFNPLPLRGTPLRTGKQ